MPQQDGSFKVTFSGTSGITYMIQVSPDLSNWAHIGTVTAVNGKIVFTDFDASTYATRFYGAIPWTESS